MLLWPMKRDDTRDGLPVKHAGFPVRYVKKKQKILLSQCISPFPDGYQINIPLY